MATHSHPLAPRFVKFARECAALNSPFYQRLSLHVAQEPRLLDIASHAVREPITNVFFGAVHYFLLKHADQGADHPLRDYYPSLAANPRPGDALFVAFSDFCLRHRDEIISLVVARLTQTNEVNRSAFLAPAFHVVASLTGGQPLALVEVGTSAGLNLYWDEYRIAYSDGTLLGDPASSVLVESELRGNPLPAAIAAPLKIAHRIGIDHNPIDLHDPDAQLWLRALVWPDHRLRAARLDTAIALAAHRKSQLLRGDALELLPATLAQLPPDCAACVFHSTVLYQFTPEARDRFFSLLAAASAHRPLWHVFAEDESGLKLFLYRAGRLAGEQFLAHFDAHGRWLDWQAP
jgi:hypothetical protein